MLGAILGNGPDDVAAVEEGRVWPREGLAWKRSGGRVADDKDGGSREGNVLRQKRSDCTSHHVYAKQGKCCCAVEAGGEARETAEQAKAVGKRGQRGKSRKVTTRRVRIAIGWSKKRPWTSAAIVAVSAGGRLEDGRHGAGVCHATFDAG